MSWMFGNRCKFKSENFQVKPVKILECPWCGARGQDGGFVYNSNKINSSISPTLLKRTSGKTKLFVPNQEYFKFYGNFMRANPVGIFFEIDTNICFHKYCTPCTFLKCDDSFWCNVWKLTCTIKYWPNVEFALHLPKFWRQPSLSAILSSISSTKLHCNKMFKNFIFLLFFYHVCLIIIQSLRYLSHVHSVRENQVNLFNGPYVHCVENIKWRTTGGEEIPQIKIFLHLLFEFNLCSNFLWPGD